MNQWGEHWQHGQRNASALTAVASALTVAFALTVAWSLTNN
jgi:hypothetical protein